eukprot:CAMPEP_0185849654 /NCGR_PEP_ID=MMETSP1354-20130828/4091_1 /TAXON_ID=708628 /ORGANISM="Erythrolobus madagascarensis, Strain CCMP3276" /LENGTH=357 /DNA_ID=CAMNT_0028550221 /DNA_START=121 /DNA_END=1194 /DNA_ORIENTATION=-
MSKGHRRSKTAGVSQLEAFDALALETGGDWDGIQETVIASEATTAAGVGDLLALEPVQLGEPRAALNNLGLETATVVAPLDAAAQGALDSLQPGLMQSQPDMCSGKRSERRSSVRPASVRRSVVETSIKDGILRERLRDLAEEEGNQFITIIDTWEALAVLEGGDFVMEEFCTAMESILIVVDAFGGALSLIKNDWRGQMAKVRQSCVKHGVVTLHRMIECENAKGEGTDCLIWLKRSLQFVEIMMSIFVSAPFKNETGRNPLGDAVEIAYKRTLHDAHPWIVRAVASKIRFAVPPAELFVKRLHGDDPQLVIDAISLWLRIMRPKLAALVTYYNVNSIEKVTNCRALPETLVAVTA